MAKRKMGESAPVVHGTLMYDGQPIHERGDMLCLTDMWKATGSLNGKRPANWARKEGADFIEHIRKVCPGGTIYKASGRGGTWAHWQIGIAYAKYLNHDMHMWCNAVVRAHMEGKPAPDPLWAIRRDEGKEVRKAFVAELASRNVRKPQDYARATNAVYIEILGESANRFRRRHGLPNKANCRNAMSRLQLMQTGLAEELAMEQMEEERSWGPDECIEVTHMSARTVARAVQDHRANRRPAALGRI